jgi:hypothetical protein
VHLVEHPAGRRRGRRTLRSVPQQAARRDRLPTDDGVRDVLDSTLDRVADEVLADRSTEPAADGAERPADGDLPPPVVAFWMMVSAPALMSIMPTGPPTPVAMRSPPPTTIASPATYSRLSLNHSLVAAAARARGPCSPAAYASSAGLTAVELAARTVTWAGAPKRSSRAGTACGSAPPRGTCASARRWP